MSANETMNDFSTEDELSELVLNMHACTMKGQSSGPKSGCPNARRLPRCTYCAGGNLCLCTNRKDELDLYCFEVRQQLLEQLRVEQLKSPLLHVAHGGTSMTTPQPLPPELCRAQSSVSPSVDAPIGKDSTESLVAGTLVPMQSAHHSESVMEKCEADADEILGMLEAIVRSYQRVDQSPIGSFSQTACMADSFSIRKSASSTADSSGRAAEPSIGCPLQQPAIRQHSSLQSPYSSAILNRSSYNHIFHRLPLHAYSIIAQAERSQLRSDSQQNFYFHQGPSEAGCFLNQRQDLSYLPERAYHPQQSPSVFSLGQEHHEDCISYPVQGSKSDGSLNTVQMQAFHNNSCLQEGCIPLTKQVMHAQPVVAPPHPPKKKIKKRSFRDKKLMGLLRTD